MISSATFSHPWYVRDRLGSVHGNNTHTFTGDGHVLRGGEGNSAADTLEMLRFPGGYFNANLVPHYYVTDYLGSNIAVIRSDGDLVQSATYYPYGEPHRNPLIRRGIDVSAPPTADAATAAEPRTANPYLYGNKEWMYQGGLREYVYGARMHVPSLPRFTSIDPLAEKHPEHSPYLFCAANPIRFVDPSGCIFTAGAEKILAGLEQQIERHIRDNYKSAIKHLSNYLKSNNKKKRMKEAKRMIQSMENANKYIEVRNEIDELRRSDTWYDIIVEQSADPSVKGAFGYKVYSNGSPEEKTFVYYLKVRNKTAYGWIAHELKHAYQFEIGRLSAHPTFTNNTYYDLTDEEEAFERGRLFGADMPNIDYRESPYNHLPNKAEQVDPNKTDREYQAIANEKNIF